MPKKWTSCSTIQQLLILIWLFFLLAEADPSQDVVFYFQLCKLFFFKFTFSFFIIFWKWRFHKQSIWGVAQMCMVCSAFNFNMQFLFYCFFLLFAGEIIICDKGIKKFTILHFFVASSYHFYYSIYCHILHMNHWRGKKDLLIKYYGWRRSNIILSDNRNQCG